MCSIGGFSLSTNSRINPRKLANALLTEMDVRGNQASGYAWQSSTGSGVYKKDTSGARLSMKQMSKGTRLAVLHTRYATHGTIRDMANNHPVLSPDKSVALVHNGVIYNHDRVRSEMSIGSILPEVDTAVIPALLQEFDRDTDKFDMLDGDASVAWLDDNDRLVMKLARISHSPLCIAQLADGSFVFASTESILWNALKVAGLAPVYMENVPERVLMTIRDGVLADVEALPELDKKYENDWTSYYSKSSYRGMTAGGKGVSIYTSEPNASIFGDVEDTEMIEFPEVDGMIPNEFGEYFDEAGIYMGSVDDLIETGYLYYDEVYGKYEKTGKFNEQIDFCYAQKPKVKFSDMWGDVSELF
jgi:hypothetical protein